MGYDHRAHVIRAPTWACVRARVGEGGRQGSLGTFPWVRRRGVRTLGCREAQAG